MEDQRKTKRIIWKAKKPNGFKENQTKAKKADKDNDKDKEEDILKKEKKKKYGENQNVLFTDEEYEKVKAYFPNDYIERIQSLDDYIQSKGKKYKDFFATLKTWARKDGYKPPEISLLSKKEVQEIDIEKLSAEEYQKLVKGVNDV